MKILILAFVGENTLIKLITPPNRSLGFSNSVKFLGENNLITLLLPLRSKSLELSVELSQISYDRPLKFRCVKRPSNSDKPPPFFPRYIILIEWVVTPAFYNPRLINRIVNMITFVRLAPYTEVSGHFNTLLRNQLDGCSTAGIEIRFEDLSPYPHDIQIEVLLSKVDVTKTRHVYLEWLHDISNIEELDKGLLSKGLTWSVTASISEL